MKTRTVNTFAKKFFYGNIVAAILFLSFQNKAVAGTLGNSATNKVDSTTSIEKKNMRVYYLGSNTEGYLINVCYENAKSNNCSFVITDADGEVLYENSFNNINFSKTLLLPKSVDANKIYISIKNEGSLTALTSEVDISTKMIEDVSVRIK